MAMSLFPRIFDEVLRRVLRRKAPPTVPSAPPPSPEVDKEHPWRRCGAGRHWVRGHSTTVPVSSKGPAYPTPRGAHCADNPRKRKGSPVQYFLNKDEIEYIRDTYFSTLTGPPASGKMKDFHGREDQFDSLIRGWVRYWNEVFSPGVPLDPDLVKALIGSESSFNPTPASQDAGVAGKARGLIQLTDTAIHALGDSDGELKNHLVKITHEQTSDPNMAICAGVRWLFRKQRLASGLLGREASWKETVAHYKGCLDQLRAHPEKVPHDMKRFNELLTEQKR